MEQDLAYDSSKCTKSDDTNCEFCCSQRNNSKCANTKRKVCNNTCCKHKMILFDTNRRDVITGCKCKSYRERNISLESVALEIPTSGKYIQTKTKSDKVEHNYVTKNKIKCRKCDKGPQKYMIQRDYSVKVIYCRKPKIRDKKKNLRNTTEFKKLYIDNCNDIINTYKKSFSNENYSKCKAEEDNEKFRKESGKSGKKKYKICKDQYNDNNEETLIGTLKLNSESAFVCDDSKCSSNCRCNVGCASSDEGDGCDQTEGRDYSIDSSFSTKLINLIRELDKESICYDTLYNSSCESNDTNKIRSKNQRNAYGRDNYHCKNNYKSGISNISHQIPNTIIEERTIGSSETDEVELGVTHFRDFADEYSTCSDNFKSKETLQGFNYTTDKHIDNQHNHKVTGTSCNCNNNKERNINKYNHEVTGTSCNCYCKFLRNDKNTQPYKLEVLKHFSNSKLSKFFSDADSTEPDQSSPEIHTNDKRFFGIPKLKSSNTSKRIPNIKDLHLSDCVFCALNKNSRLSYRTSFFDKETELFEKIVRNCSCTAEQEPRDSNNCCKNAAAFRRHFRCNNGDSYALRNQKMNFQKTNKKY